MNYNESILKEKEQSTPEHDELVLWTYNNLSLILGAGFEAEQRIIESPIFKIGYNYKRDIVAFADLLVYSKTLRPPILFEIKIKIPSLGNLLRQLNNYAGLLEMNSCKNRIFVVSNDDKFKTIIEEQGFKFIKPDDFKQ